MMLTSLTVTQTVSAKPGDRMKYVVYSKINTKTWVTWYKTETFGIRKMIAGGWMEPGKSFTQELIEGNTYYVRGDVMNDQGKKIYDTTAKVEIGPGYPTSKTLMKGSDNYYWQ
ncbi:MAG TPA: hypothetical protein VMF11_03725 [Candidatus Baltobacteraceae bacterium]|nr:hypothetical protein [Candidatus Baltobacteraceae bacterium]